MTYVGQPEAVDDCLAELPVQHDLPHGGVEVHLASPGTDVVHHGLAQADGRGAVKERHLGAVRLLQHADTCKGPRGELDALSSNRAGCRASPHQDLTSSNYS